MTANAGALCQISVMLIRAACTGDVLDNPKKLRFSATSVQQVKDASSYTDTVTSKLGYYYDSTVSFLTDDCGVGSYSVATGKAVIYGVCGGPLKALFMICGLATVLRDWRSVSSSDRVWVWLWA